MQEKNVFDPESFASAPAEGTETLPKKRHPLRKLLKVLLTLLLAVMILVSGAAGIFVVATIASAPQLSSVSVTPVGYRSTIENDAGEVTQLLAGEEANRVYVELDTLPEHLKNAFIAIEDERFYSHHGVDWQGIARALIRNISTRDVSQGASTITQQLIKNNVFPEFATEQSVLQKVRRKIQEQHLALKLEEQQSKDWILENYLNTINLGSGTWGVETAAQRYFGKHASELTLSESAVLAAIPKGPSLYDPLKHPENNAARRELVLMKIEELGLASAEEIREARADDVYARIGENATVGEEPFSYFEDALISEVLEDLKDVLGYSDEAAWRLIYRGGITIRSTEDSVLQGIAEEELNRSGWYDSDAQSACVLLDPATGAVKAIVGGRGAKTASLTLNRALSSPRQPGSTIKVIGEYAAALESGKATLGSAIDDAPYTYSDGTTVRNASGVYGGMTTLRTAIEESTNVVALKIFQEVGAEAVFDQLTDFGLAHLSENDRVEALALGGTAGGVTCVELAAAYGSLAAGGVYRAPHFYTRVLDHDGKVLLEKSVESHTAVSQGTAELLTDAMTGVMTRGTGTAANVSGRTLAGKSGTTTDLRDLWFAGYSPDLVCAVWGGYDDYSTQSSSAYVKKLWRAVMERALESRPSTSFTRETPLSTRLICTKCGRLAETGLCSDSVQGDMTRSELYLPGTEPTESCTCHVRLRICTVSHALAGTNCPESTIEEKVYLRSASEGTSDTAFVAPIAADGETCSVHTHWWDRYGLFSGGSGGSSGSGSGFSWWPFGGRGDEGETPS